MEPTIEKERHNKLEVEADFESYCKLWGAELPKRQAICQVCGKKAK